MMLMNAVSCDVMHLYLIGYKLLSIHANNQAVDVLKVSVSG